MKLSTTATYGLRICFLLALSEKTLSLPVLVERTDLSEKYLERILGMLRKGGIVGAKRGAGGGYYLLRPPSSISVSDILNALGGNIVIAECAAGKCDDAYCPNRNLFRKIYGAVDEIVHNTTLEDMIYEYRCDTKQKSLS